ncbi:homoserine O-succinyltransferase [Methylocystis sp. ATCC 49242]|uniref:homoserine O-succinyltransferase MetA n=1 Tax=Methylocystis sp. ATCC 49242 TaxID=622637 RepID=UPI0001F86806|nr:homoserine O-succinyltransferase [Methylocystis sp. ATCC 49242]
MTSTCPESDDVIEVALVNNMPDQALPATQRQFSSLVQLGARGRRVQWRCYALPGVERSETARRYLERSHEDIGALYRRGAHALIVTGAEPRAARLDEEPYWPDLQCLVDWARENTLSTIWSCLAAHAAVLHLDGIERRRASKKISGVYTFKTTAQDWIHDPGAPEITVAHSRYNDVVREELEDRGYHIASHSEEVGVDVFWRREPSLFLFLQGHPEYDADTLLKEYRRDVLRFLSGRRDDYPCEPENFFAPETSEKLSALRAAVMNGLEDDAEKRLTQILSMEKCRAAWSDDATRLYRRWLKAVARQMETRREIA